jgi:transposase-like protein
VGDETYIKIGGEQNYVWFCVSASKRTITAYHLTDDRETRSAVTTLQEAFSTASPGQELTFISDGLGSYTEAIHFLNSSREHNKIKHIQVIGLKDKDDVSEQYRSFKQLIERFNRTYKHHVKPAVGFNSFNGAMALTVLFVTYYNFLRPHMSLNYRTPIQIHQLDGINTIQARWVKLLSMMY